MEKGLNKFLGPKRGLLARGLKNRTYDRYIKLYRAAY